MQVQIQEQKDIDHLQLQIQKRIQTQRTLMGADLSPEKDKSVSIATIFRINISKRAHFCLDTHVAGKKIHETSCIKKPKSAKGTFKSRINFQNLMLHSNIEFKSCA